jgi:hypothetical protein
MHDVIEPIFSAWESFYVIVGSSAAALTGLQFVVMALVADTRARSTPETIDAFGTPTVVHFCSALLVSAVLSAPWHTPSSVMVIFGVAGIAGLVYCFLVIRRARRQTGYEPVFEDWLWHAALPFAAYAILVIAALSLRIHVTGSLFAIAAVALLLLFIGIHNSWDSVTFIVARQAEGRQAEMRKTDEKPKEDEKPAAASQ